MSSYYQISREVHYILYYLSSGKAEGPDTVTNKIRREGVTELFTPLSERFRTMEAFD